MRKKWKRRTAFTLFTVITNMALITCVISSVLFAFNDAKEVSFDQNIENVRTLTDASANKVELEITHYTREITTVSEYVNNYHGTGMTEEELSVYFKDCYPVQDTYSWQLVNSTLNDENASKEKFEAISLNADRNSFSYRVKAYPELSKIFGTASESTIGQIHYTSEFTDSSPALAKSFAVTTTVRVRNQDAAGAEDYEYKTLMLLIESDHINQLISNNNNINTLSFFDYSNIIVDDAGNYVISNSYFQGTNFADYIALYNADFTKEEAASLQESLLKEDYSDVLYYQNNRGQDCAYTIVPVQNSDWHILSIVPIESFHSADHYSANYMRFFLSFLLLFIVDMTFVLMLNLQLRRKKKEAEAASIAKSQFLSSMSHDIRTPMNAIIGMTLIAEENLEEELPDRETLKDCIKTIELSGNHLLTLINDVLDISKIESGKIVFSADDFSISETIGKMLEIVQPQMKEKAFHFETHIVNVNHEFVHADELRINQIFINILSNAIKYTNFGGKITVDLIEEEIPGKTDVSRFIYKVSDNGIGMDEEFQKALFERFTRAVDTRINEVQGSGLGMSIVKQLVDLMGGTITVESELNVGSTFVVSLDLPVADIRTESISLQDMSALLIDDDPILLETAEMTLTKAGMTIATASSGQAGIEAAIAGKQKGMSYDVILVDWKMSRMNGIEVVRELRNKLGEDTKIIVMKAYNIADIEHDARIAGVNGFITKPLFKSKLLHTIQSAFVGNEGDKKPVQKQTFDLNVLIAEDNHVNSRILEKLLNRYNIHTEKAENGQKAFEMVKKGNTKYDLILMDIQMPVMNGYAATEAIRALEDKEKASIPIYAMTADTFAEDVAKCFSKGMNGHLSKPIEIEKLLKVLTQISSQKSKI